MSESGMPGAICPEGIEGGGGCSSLFLYCEWTGRNAMIRRIATSVSAIPGVDIMDLVRFFVIRSVHLRKGKLHHLEGQLYSLLSRKSRLLCKEFLEHLARLLGLEPEHYESRFGILYGLIALRYT